MLQTSTAVKGRVLLVEDDQIARLTLEEQLQDCGYKVSSFETAEAALEASGDEQFEVALSDVRLPGMSGIELLERLKKDHPGMIVVMLTGYGTVQDAVQAMRLGAWDYLCKPASADEIVMRIDRALSARQALQDRDRLQREVEKQYSYHNIIGHSAAMQRVFALVESIKDIDPTVLIEGETGSGKDLLARAIHFSGTRREEPFVAVNCMVLSRDLLESELFGHERGAFTGALAEKPGRFELARRGTVMLDDIDDIPLDLQGKLIDVLERRRFERVGGCKSIPLECRVLCVTKKNLADLVQQGKFRDDLYYRMNVVNVRIPPLRERKDDIPHIARHYVQHYAERMGRPLRQISAEAMQVLLAHDWPGNVRELEHTVERAVALGSGETLLATDLPPALQPEQCCGASYTLHLPNEGKVNLPQLLDEVEAKALRWAMSLADGQQSKAAELLMIPRTTFQAKYGKHS